MHPGHYIDEGTYALLGAASFLGGAMRLTVCTCVMLLELTNNLALLPLIMLVLLVAKVGSGWGGATTKKETYSCEQMTLARLGAPRYNVGDLAVIARCHVGALVGGVFGLGA